ncbi:DNA-directed DNA polymerase [Moritella viscosa]|uniref:DNA polymerase n=1 Tax=Moritella viscosa TaxID=80854 RepID=UPI0009188129|nr:DNA polymerase [Moritella viscosa]SGZ10003.1 DNA-directed DNA polymerase [Moritella viscosa]
MEMILSSDNELKKDNVPEWMLEYEGKESPKNIKSHPPKMGETVVLSLDTELTLAANGLDNEMESYQYTIGVGEIYCSGIVYPSGKGKNKRLALDKFIVIAIEDAISKSIFKKYPEHIILCAHMMRADLFTFKDAFKNIKTKVSGVRGTVASLEGAYGLDLEAELSKRIDKEPLKVWDSKRNDHIINITFYDTMLLAPAGKGLADVGKLVGQPKIKIKPPYSIERMHEFREGDKASFEEYAINDTIIAYLHLQLLIDFCSENGIKKVPFTLGGLAVKAFKNNYKKENKKNNYKADFGYIKTKKEIWVESENGKSGYRTVSKDVLDESRSTCEQFFTNAYSGGYNSNFHTGPTVEGEFYDFDLQSCYTAILNSLRPLDYDATFMTQDPEDFLMDVCGAARVEFEFPNTVLYPCLPVRANNNCLSFPRKGISYATAPEIAVALSLEAKITIIQGFIVPFKVDADGEPCKRIFSDFMILVREKREKYKKLSDEFNEKMWKELGNSIYGKLAQGLRAKTAFDVKVGYSKQTPASDLTNPYFASMVTGAARAVLAEVLNVIPKEKTIISVTTDGFLTNASLDEIDLNGVMCNRFRELFHIMDADKGEILVLKHKANQLIGMKTQGQLTVIRSDGFEPVIAKAGVQVPREEKDQHQYMLDLYLDRYPGEMHKMKYLTSSNKMFSNDKDMINEEVEKRLNLEPDYKRNLINPRMVTLADGREHIALDSEPFNTVEEMMFTRLRFDQWRKNNCLKTLDDWSNWSEVLAMYKASKMKGVKLKKGEKSDGLMCRLFLRGYQKGAWGLDSSQMTARALAEWLTDNGYPTKATAVRTAKRAKLIEHAVPKNDLSLAFLNLLQVKFPSFDSQKLFAA